MLDTTPGQYLVRKMLPDAYKNFEGRLDGKGVKTLFTKMAKELPGDDYARVLKRLNNFGNKVATQYGGSASIHLRDLRLPPELKAMRQNLADRINAVQQDRTIPSAEKKSLIIQMVKKETPAIDEAVMKSFGNMDNSFGLQVSAGIKGKPQQLRQLVFGDLLNVDSKHREVPYPTLRSYGEGVTPLQYWTASHGGRQGYIGVQKATADAGYLSKMIRRTVDQQVITEEDCGRPQAYIVDADDDNNVGSLLFKDVKGKSGKLYKKDTIITEDILNDLKGTVAIRSANTCGSAEGLCAKCAGKKERNRLPEIGEYVGVNNVNAFLERFNQGGLESKHIGGEASTSRRAKRGLAAVSQFINVPDTFVGGALISEAEGRVTNIRPAPQGGNFITIGDVEQYVDGTHTLKVGRGDYVEAGDVLTDGMPNIEKIVQGKGLGEGRRQFTQYFSDLLDENRFSTQRKNIEAFARGFLNRVRITDPDGYDGKIIDDIVDYNALAAKWKPREGSSEVSPDDAVGSYLEQPSLHYTIGTKITPSVVKSFRDAGVSKLITHKDPPPFEPVVIAARNFSEHDEEWLPAMSGENLTRSFLAHVQRGSTSNKKGTSIYSKLPYMSSYTPDPLKIAD